MADNKVKQEIEHLRAQINQWNYEYYALDNPSVSDAVFDKTMKQLIELEKQYPEYKTKDSPTVRVGGYVSDKFEKIKHPKPMMSLDNVFNKDELSKWLSELSKIIDTSNMQFSVEPKIDGLSIALIYEHGKLVRAVTRGDGKVGEDVTTNVKTIKTVPLYIKTDLPLVEVRGEVYMDKQDFANLNANLEDYKQPFANPRNAAAGTLRTLDSSIVASRNLKQFAYYLPNALEMGLESQHAAIQWMIDHKFNVAPIIQIVHGIDQVMEAVDHITQLRSSLDYQIDGIVIKVDNIHLYDEIGSTSKFPKWAIAYKFEPVVEQTVIESITPSVGRTGKITYTANVTPIEVDGSMIANATLNNLEYIQQKDIRIHDTIYLFKAGDVIPYVDTVNLDKRTDQCVVYQGIQVCPSCGSQLVREDGEVDQFCLNHEHCQDQLIKTIDFFASRGCMNILGLSEAIISKFFAHGIIHDSADLYDLESKKEAIYALDLKIKQKSLTNLLTAIEASKQNSCERLFNGLGIRHIGKESAKKLCAHFKNIRNIMDATFDQLIQVNDIGEEIASSILSFFANPINQALIAKFEAAGLNMEYKVDLAGYEDLYIDPAYTNKTCVITGTFGIPRDQIKFILTNFYHCKVSESVSKKTDFVLVGDNPGSKAQKARELQVPVIDHLFWLQSDPTKNSEKS